LSALVADANEVGVIRSDHVPAVIADVSLVLGVTHSFEEVTFHAIRTTDNLHGNYLQKRLPRMRTSTGGGCLGRRGEGHPPPV